MPSSDANTHTNGARLRVVRGALGGQHLRLSAPETIVGRSADCDAVLDDPTVSRRHAVFRRHGPDVVVQDLGSTGGTTVNGDQLRGTRVLRPGDRLRLAGVDLCYESDDQQSEVTSTLAAPGARAGTVPLQHPSPGNEYHVGSQEAHVLSNVGRDQYVQHVQMQRESFLREIAAARSRARTLIWLGFFLTVCGVIAWAGVVLDFMSGIESASYDDVPTLLGPAVGGVPVGVVALGVAVTGKVMFIVGVVLHIIAASRRRGVERQPWPPGPFYDAPRERR